jgi:negative regulator of flagellin synthesis FlgM
MAIESVSGNSPNVSLLTKPVDKGVSNNPSPPNSTSTDAVEFSYSTQDIKNAIKASATVPVINQDRVAALKGAIQSGSYQPNAARTASKILQFDNQLSNST